MIVLKTVFLLIVWVLFGIVGFCLEIYLDEITEYEDNMIEVFGGCCILGPISLFFIAYEVLSNTEAYKNKIHIILKKLIKKIIKIMKEIENEI